MNVNDIIKKYQNNVHFEFEKKERDFIKLSELEEQSPEKTHEIHGIFINKESEYGPQGVIVTDDYNVNLPQHLTELCENLRSDDDIVKAVNHRKLGFNIYKYKTKKGREGYSINLVPLDTKNNVDDDDLPF